MDRSPRGVILRSIPAVLWAAAIYLSSEIPGSSLPSSGGLAPVAHFVEYAILAGLIVFALPVKRPPAARIAIAVTLATAFGVLDELHQSFTPGRTPDVWDVAVDLAGALLGATVVGRLIERLRARNLSR